MHSFIYILFQSSVDLCSLKLRFWFSTQCYSISSCVTLIFSIASIKILLFLLVDPMTNEKNKIALSFHSNIAMCRCQKKFIKIDNRRVWVLFGTNYIFWLNKLMKVASLVLWLLLWLFIIGSWESFKLFCDWKSSFSFLLYSTIDTSPWTPSFSILTSLTCNGAMTLLSLTCFNQLIELSIELML